MEPKNPVLPLVKQVREVSTIEEAEKLVATQDWVVIMIYHPTDDTISFVLGRVN